MRYARLPPSPHRSTVIDHQHSHAMALRIPLQQCTVVGVAALADQQTRGINLRATLSGLSRMLSAAEVGAYRERHGPIIDAQQIAAHSS